MSCFFVPFVCLLSFFLYICADIKITTKEKCVTLPEVFLIKSFNAFVSLPRYCQYLNTVTITTFSESKGRWKKHVSHGLFEFRLLADRLAVN